MTPNYIKSILRKHYNDDLGGKNKSIAIITDGQNPHAITNLKNDTELGSRIIVLSELLETQGFNNIRHPYNDMMIPIMPNCEVFIGTRASAFAEIAAMFRIAIAISANDHSNYAHTTYFNETNISTINVCTECLLLCPKADTHGFCMRNGGLW